MAAPVEDIPRFTLPRIMANIPGLSTVPEEDDWTSLFPQLSLKERLIGFGVCIFMGFMITLSSFGSFGELLAGRPLRFATLYSLGNVTSLGSTIFLVGPKQQWKNMTHKKRRVSAGIYTFCLVMTLVTVFTVPELKGLIIALVVVQWAALSWYSLSYIPYGRRMARGLASRLLA
jgi:hypothetical protein